MTNVFANVATVVQTIKDSRWVRTVIDCTVLWKPVKYQVITYIQIKLESDPTYQGKYHTSYVTRYITKATSSAEKQKRAISSPSHLYEKRTWPFDWLRQCFYYRGSCNVDQDLKNPNRWIPSYLVRETEEKHKKEGGTEKADAIEHRIKDKCDKRMCDVLGRLTCLTRWRALPHILLCPILQRALSSR